MSHLAEFILARIAEDEAAARAAYRSPWRQDDCHVWTENSEWDPEGGPTVYVNGGTYRNQALTAAHIARWDPARVLAECSAKRLIVETRNKLEAQMAADDPLGMGDDAQLYTLDWVLQRLAVPYADHREYRQEWAP